MGWYIDQNAVCPFYRREESSEIRKIHCDGFDDVTAIAVWFKTKVAKRMHKRRFCQSVRGCRDCPMYQAIEKKYEENDYE